jgi:hypothetical protein
MKCIGCGGEIGLTDEFCPHCGRKITETAGFRADLKGYQEKSEKTKKGLAKTLSENVPMLISVVVMVVLLIGLGIASYINEEAYHFRSDALRKEAKKNYETYSVEIQKYLDAGDYTGFAAFKENHNIAEWEEPYDDLRLLWEINEEYTSLVANVESVVMFGPEARWYRPEMEVEYCQDAIRDFYHEYEYRQDEIENDTYAAYIHDMKREADAILKVYLGLDDEEREAFLESSDIEQRAYLEEVLIHETEEN